MAKEKLVEFLINISFIGPVGWSEEDVAALVTRERAHAAELAREGYLVRMWRVPGRRENWGLWRARDATHMHEIISGLPFWPYMQLTIHPMASHPVDPLRFGA
ncbi:muconolactone Delta-isomerase family protein [Aquamicrobium lusatiense]|jgi:muconolactone D-isomerase|uniref:Muconolactone D-isomerase n=1 Tax=Aquamicrobium lusatiense TaxID=89772 RepID=A0A7W9S5P7_9HYPH|nr:muconolactone Delta-isomerase family protein [Aquamicrobium lusatiense]MBB6014587.1 muconolactone D-isomerase [Aquamicrobium lusatiense]MDH4989701.1 muconolactone Delta-isomerase family protein [Aquamicrobium lusatiense]